MAVVAGTPPANKILTVRFLPLIIGLKRESHRLPRRIGQGGLVGSADQSRPVAVKFDEPTHLEVIEFSDNINYGVFVLIAGTGEGPVRMLPRSITDPEVATAAGVEFIEGQDEVQLQYKPFTEIIRKVDITEEVYYPSKEEEETITTTYYAHIGIIRNENDNTFTLFANWDYFLEEYFLTAGKANEKLVGGEQQKDKLIDSFRNYAPTLYKVLTDESSEVKPMRGFKIGEESLNVMAVINASNVEEAKDELINTCVNICKEINTTTHLAVWRRYLRTVWLHI